MPPKAHLEPHLSTEQIKTRYRQAKDTTEARRWHLLSLVAQNWTIKQAAEVVGLNYDYAKQIIQRYNQEGPTSTINHSKKKRVSSRSLLTPDQQAELARALKYPAPDGEAWSGPKVAHWIAQKTGLKRVWPQRGWDYLRRLGSSPIDKKKLRHNSG
jgi:transposase